MNEEKKNMEQACDENALPLTEAELSDITGGNDGYCNMSNPFSYAVYVKTSYLALRTRPAYQYENEIGKMWNGYTFTVDNSVAPCPPYVYGYCDQLGNSGWTNGRFLFRNGHPIYY